MNRTVPLEPIHSPAAHQLQFTCAFIHEPVQPNVSHMSKFSLVCLLKTQGPMRNVFLEACGDVSSTLCLDPSTLDSSNDHDPPLTFSYPDSPFLTRTIPFSWFWKNSFKLHCGMVLWLYLSKCYLYKHLILLASCQFCHGWMFIKYVVNRWFCNSGSQNEQDHDTKHLVCIIMSTYSLCNTLPIYQLPTNATNQFISQLSLNMFINDCCLSSNCDLFGRDWSLKFWELLSPQVIRHIFGIIWWKEAESI